MTTTGIEPAAFWSLDLQVELLLAVGRSKPNALPLRHVAMVESRQSQNIYTLCMVGLLMIRSLTCFHSDIHVVVYRALTS